MDLAAGAAQRTEIIMRLGRAKVAWMYETMVKIRAFEERAAKEFSAGNIPGFVHLYSGEEAVAVGVCAQLRPDDYVVGTHRSHGHCIAKGLDIKALMAELYGRKTGTCGGKGGSMHVADLSKGMLGAVPVVGGGVPLALGAALTAKVKGRDQVAVAFFGDGAANQGVVMESLNLAVVLRLPVVFVCENNSYAQSTPRSYAQAIDCVARRALGFGMPGVTVDGMDVMAVSHAADEAIALARGEHMPTLLEACTYRYRGHFEGDAQRYRSADEVNAHRLRDPIAGCRRDIIEARFLTAGDLDAIERAIDVDIDAAVRYAEGSPDPGPEETYTDVYA